MQGLGHIYTHGESQIPWCKVSIYICQWLKHEGQLNLSVEESSGSGTEAASFLFCSFCISDVHKTNRVYKSIPDLFPHEQFKLCHFQTGLCIQCVSCQPGYWKKDEFQKDFIRREVQAALVCNCSIRWSARKLDFTDTNILHGHCHNQNFSSHRF